MVVNTSSCLYLAAFAVIFCFPDSLPVTGRTMNYTAFIVIGWTLLATVWWFMRMVMDRLGVDLYSGWSALFELQTAFCLYRRLCNGKRL